MREMDEKAIGLGRDDFTQDGTVDLKGQPILRSKGGRWKACSFIVGYEIFERMAYYGIASNLVLYLTKRLHEGTVASSNNVTNWAGTVWLTPILGAYVADAYLGRYWTFVIASAIYLMGMCLLTLAVSLPALRPPSCPGIPDILCDKRATPFQVGIFYCALYIIAIGTGGTKPNISTMGADQFDDYEPKERIQKLSFFNWHKAPSGSPFTRMAKVIVASIRKWSAPVPNDPKELHELGMEEYAKTGKYRIDRTPALRILDKAAVKSGPSNPWTLCPVTQVEETKQMLKMIPILLATVIPSTMLAQSHTLFIKQGATLNRSIGPHFEIPPACLTAFVTIFMLISLVIYDQFFVPAIRQYTKNPRGLTLLQRMGIGLVIHIMIMVVASLVEMKRLKIAKENGIVGKNDIVPLTIFILLPQYALMGVADTFVEVAKIEFFYDQAPEGMKSLGTSYFTTTLGIGNFLSSFLLSTVASITKRNGHQGWILNNLNISHLDYYYGFYVVLTFLNFIFFLVVAKYYVYNADVESERGLPNPRELVPSQGKTQEGLKGDS
ncbi:hypothetical protein IFM89_029504 [Coptis chinensis]|uniref:Peptide transporter n=1 Tax=Coptis chinensis TaxID=261450 RepID=A0A835HTX9_9MAGN|nr:hypothetical protein IFM89_029504 [Coptis chinensis]